VAAQHSVPAQLRETACYVYALLPSGVFQQEPTLPEVVRSPAEAQQRRLLALAPVQHLPSSHALPGSLVHAYIERGREILGSCEHTCA
jgi:hypothetical protein